MWLDFSFALVIQARIGDIYDNGRGPYVNKLYFFLIKKLQCLWRSR